MNVHLMHYGETACGIDPFVNGELRSTQHIAIVTCPDCKASAAGKSAVQRIPIQPPRPDYQPVQKVR